MTETFDINNLTLIDDEQMNVDWGRDADQSPPPPPDAVYRVTVDYKEADSAKRWLTKFKVPNADGKTSTAYDVTGIDGQGSSAIVSVRERKRDENHEPQEYEFTRKEGTLFVTTGVKLTLVGVRPDKKTEFSPDEKLWLGRPVFDNNVSSALNRDNTSKATDMIKAFFPLDQARQANSSGKIVRMIDTIVAGQLTGEVAIWWEGQTETYNKKTDGGYLDFASIPRGMKNFPVNENSPYGHDTEVERSISGETYYFRAFAVVRHWVPLRSEGVE